VIPGQYLIEHTATQIKVGVDVVFSKGLLPQIESELISPAVKPTTKAICGKKRAS
jgi:hypothetical protein